MKITVGYFMVYRMAYYFRMSFLNLTTAFWQVNAFVQSNLFAGPYHMTYADWNPSKNDWMCFMVNVSFLWIVLSMTDLACAYQPINWPRWLYFPDYELIYS